MPKRRKVGNRKGNTLPAYRKCGYSKRRNRSDLSGYGHGCRICGDRSGSAYSWRSFDGCVNEGVRKGYTEGYLRKSVVSDPFIRVNTNDNTPAIIHYDIVGGDNVKIIVAPKGFGSENMSKIYMLKPSAGIEGAKDAIVRLLTRQAPTRVRLWL